MINLLPRYFRLAPATVLMLFIAHVCVCIGSNAEDSKPAPVVPAPPPPAPPAPGVAPDTKAPVGPDTKVEGEPKSGKLSADSVMSGLDWSATKQSFLEEKGAIVLSGSAWVRYQGVKLEADNIVFYRETREMYAEGNVLLLVADSTMAASAAYIDVDSDSGYLVDAVVRVAAKGDVFGSQHAKNGIKEEKPSLAREDTTRRKIPGEENHITQRDPYGIYDTPTDDPQARTSVIMRADKLIRHSKLHFTTENAFVTNDEMVHPIYGVKAGNVDF
jgi:hypothetical protein